jgi:SAM-dependent methyltransferase
MRLPLSTTEKSEYADHWFSNAAHFEKQGCYGWMAEQLRPLPPKRILDIGSGTGEGLLALLSAFSPTIISLEENADCIRRSCEVVSAAGYSVDSVFRLGYQEFKDGSHEIHYDQTPIVTSQQVTLVHADTLVDDPEMFHFLTASAPFDAVTVWLMGTYMMRRTCRNISNLRIADSNEYRLHVQNRLYTLADRVLRPGGWLQVVDRGEVPKTQLLIDDLFNSHHDQARSTSLEVFDVSYREYTEPTDRGIRMVTSLGTSGRKADLSTLAMLSILSRKPKNEVV